MKNQFAERLAKRRKEFGMSRKELADKLAINENQIWRYETGRNDPTAEIVYQFCQALGTSADYLLGLSESNVVLHPSKKKYIFQQRFLGEVYHRYADLDNLEAELLDEFRKKTLAAKQKALEIIRLL